MLTTSVRCGRKEGAEKWAKVSAKGKAWQAGPTRLVACFHPNISPLENADISLFERPRWLLLVVTMKFDPADLAVASGEVINSGLKS